MITESGCAVMHGAVPTSQPLYAFHTFNTIVYYVLSDESRGYMFRQLGVHLQTTTFSFFTEGRLQSQIIRINTICG